MSILANLQSLSPYNSKYWIKQIELISLLCIKILSLKTLENKKKSEGDTTLLLKHGHSGDNVHHCTVLN